MLANNDATKCAYSIAQKPETTVKPALLRFWLILPPNPKLHLQDFIFPCNVMGAASVGVGWATDLQEFRKFC